MTEHELLAAVLADPDADEPRAAYAAALGGNPRADFIRAQLAAAEMRRRGRVAKAYELEASVRPLLREHGPAWIQPFAGLVQGREPRFHRGFVEGVTMHPDDFLATAAELRRHTPIRHLWLKSAPADLDAFAGDPALAGLVTLSLSNLGIGDDGLQALAASPHLARLRSLDVGFNGIGRGGLETLAIATAPGGSLARLAYVNLAGNRAPDPQETYGVDGMSGAMVADSIDLPPLGRELEARHGRRDWLHSASLLPVHPPLEADF